MAHSGRDLHLGGRGPRGWKKLHLGVDGSGVIVAQALTGGHVDDATTALGLIAAVDGEVRMPVARRTSFRRSRRRRYRDISPARVLETGRSEG